MKVPALSLHQTPFSAVFPNTVLQEDRCYASGQTDGDKGRGDDNREQTSKDEDSGDEEEEEGGENSMDRLNRFRRGYEVALSTDTQGYRVSSKAGNNTLSPRELTAISWAAFSTETFSGEDAFYRIQVSLGVVVACVKY